MSSERAGGTRERKEVSSVEQSLNTLAPELYDELRAIARHYMSHERPDHTLQPTALVHEAYLRLRKARISLHGRTHCLALAAREMRRVLVEHARAVHAKKRGGRAVRITLHDGVDPTGAPTLELLAVDVALTKLAAASERQARVAELRLFAGMQVDELARHLGVSERTVKGDWRVAKAWLARELGAPGSFA